MRVLSVDEEGFLRDAMQAVNAGEKFQIAISGSNARAVYAHVYSQADLLGVFVPAGERLWLPEWRSLGLGGRYMSVRLLVPTLAGAGAICAAAASFGFIAVLAREHGYSVEPSIHVGEQTLTLTLTPPA